MPRSRRTPASDWFLVGMFAITFSAMIVLLIVAAVSAVRAYEQPLTLCAKERVATDGGGEYRIYAVEGTFVMKDSLIRDIRFDTADAYARLQVPSKVDAELKGVRVPPLSRFPNILGVTYVEGSREDARNACIAEGLIVPDLG